MANVKFSAHHYLLMILFAGLGTAGVWWMFHDGATWTDFPTQWRICVYTLRGMDIYSFRGTADYLPEIGAISEGFHASPFGLVLENLFYGGFLPFNAAKIYFIALNIAVIVIASCLLYQKTAKLSQELGIMSFLVSLTSVNFFISTHEGNAGGMICAFLVIAWLILEEHPYTSGILIGFAMVKPQDAAIVCIALLLMKKVLSVVVAAVIDVAAWLVSSLLLKRGMLELLQEFLFAPNALPVGSSEARPFAGIFSLVSDNFLYATAASMVFGIIFLFWVYRSLPAEMPGIFKIYPAFMAVTFWCYSWALDSYVLIVPACLCLWLMFRSSSRREFWGWMLWGLFCVSGAFFRSAVCRVLMRAYADIGYYKAYDIARTLNEVGIIILGIVICVELRRIYREASS
ncbi:MAG: DUF2029 domain-containing protein [Synergistaceae bacterium]|nr:DUF2029 domain-containing protein [Synergistaceae bacterium]